MSEFSLTVNERKVAQKSKLTEIRNKSIVPAVIYGPSTKPISIEGDYRDVFNIVSNAGTSNIIELNLGSKKIRAIVKEYQTDPVTDKLTHVDFYAFDDKIKFITVVPLELVGSSKEVRELGGQMDKKNEFLRVKCLAEDLPSVVEVDVSKLKEIGQTILVEDLDVSEKVQVLNNPKDPIVNVVIPKKVKITEDKSDDSSAEAPAEGETSGSEAPAEGETSGDSNTEEAK